MLKIRKINPVLRATGVIGVTAAMVSGVTFAALNSQATLAANSVSSGTAGLEVGLAANDTGSNKPGFKIEGLIPGVGVDQKFYLENTGDTALDVTVHVPTLPGAPEGGDFGFSGYENLTFKITSPACDEVVNTNLKELNETDVELPCNALTASETEGGTTTREYTAHVDIKPEAVSGDKAGVGNFDLVFNGEAVAPTTTTPPVTTPEGEGGEG